MLKLTITINGEEVNDIEQGLDEVVRLTTEGFTSGHDSSETGNFRFSLDENDE